MQRIGDHKADAFGGIRRIEGEVGSPGFVDGEHGDDKCRGARQGDTNDNPRPHTERGEPPGKRLPVRLQGRRNSSAGRRKSTRWRRVSVAPVRRIAWPASLLRQRDGRASGKPMQPLLRSSGMIGNAASGQAEIVHAMQQQRLNARRQSRRHLRPNQARIGVDRYVDVVRWTRILNRQQPRCGKTVR